MALHSFYNMQLISPVCIKAFSLCGIIVAINWTATTNWNTLESLKILQHGCQALSSQMPTFFHVNDLTGAVEKDKDANYMYA